VLKFAEVYFAQSQQKVRPGQAPSWPVGHCYSWIVLCCGVRVCKSSPKKGGTDNIGKAGCLLDLEKLCPKWLHLPW
jgi:hypothetical protein